MKDDDQLASYLTMLYSLRYDRNWGTKILVGLERAPAAKGNHHDREGGLVEHLMEMFEIFIGMKAIAKRRTFGFMPEAVFEEELSDAKGLKAILHHDIEKAYLTFEQVFEKTTDPYFKHPWKVQYAFHPISKLLSGDVKSLWILNEYGITLDEFMMNALFWAHGGFSELKSDDVTSFGKMMYLVDEMSGNVAERLRKKTHIVRGSVLK